MRIECAMASRMILCRNGVRMTMKTLEAARFKAECLKLIKAMNRNRQPVVTTRHGRPVAMLVPVEPPGERRGMVGALRGSVLRYDDPFAPAADPADWMANR